MSAGTLVQRLTSMRAPATGGLLVPRTNTLLPPRFFALTNQVAGRWNGNASGEHTAKYSYPHIPISKSEMPTRASASRSLHKEKQQIGCEVMSFSVTYEVMKDMKLCPSELKDMKL
jgi:hypothetical protein